MSVLSVSFADQTARSTANTSLASVPIGTASSDRVVIVFLSTNDGVDPSSITIGGAAGHFVEDGSSTGGQGWIWANVPSGTTASIVLGSATSGFNTQGVWVVKGDATAAVAQTLAALVLSTPFTASTSAFSVAAGDVLIAMETADAGTTLSYSAGVTGGTQFTDTTGEVYLDGAKAYASPVSQVISGSVTVGSTGFLLLVGARIHGSRTAYSLQLNQGALSLSGQSVKPTATRSISAASGTISIAGKAVTLKSARSIAAGQGSIGLTGKAILTKRGIGMAAAQGSISISGKAATFPREIFMPAAHGSLTVTGKAVALPIGRSLNAGQGTFVLSGKSAAFPVALSITASFGSLALTGKGVTLTYTPGGGGGGGGVIPHSNPFFSTPGPGMALP